MKKIIIAAVLSCCIMFVSCNALQGIASQLQGLANLANCEYALKNVSNLTVAGVNVKNITDGKIGLADIAKLTAALVSKKVPLNMDVNIDVKNPTTSNAALTAMDWILEIDGTEFANGISNKAYDILAGKTTSIPLGVSTDIYSLFSSDGIESLKNFVSSFTSDGISSKVGLKIKPSLNVGGVSIPSPTYIKLEKGVGKKSGSSTSTSTSTNSNSGSNSGKGISDLKGINGK